MDNNSANSQNTPNNFQFDPNLLNNPQFQAMVQLFTTQSNLNNPNNTSQNPNFVFPMSQHFQQMECSPGGDASSNATPTSEIRTARHLEEIEDVAVELFPEEPNVIVNNKKTQKQAKKTSQAKVSQQTNELQQPKV